jgi:hypothetical protein
MGLLESFGTKDKVSYEQLKDQTEDAIADAMELANDVQSKLANAKQELADAQALATAKLEEIKTIQRTRTRGSGNRSAGAAKAVAIIMPPPKP